MGFHPYLRRSVLEDVCVHNNGVLEVPTSRSTASSGNSSNNNTAIISSKLIFCTTNRSLIIQQAHSRTRAKTQGAQKRMRVFVCADEPQSTGPKPNVTIASFQFRSTSLIPGRCWCLPCRKSVCSRHMKHPEVPSHLVSVHTNCMSEKQEKNATIVARHATGGSAQNIVTDLGKEDNDKHHCCTD